MTKLIRVKDETYHEIHKLAGKMQSKSGKKTSLDKAIQALLAQKTQKPGKRTPKGQTEAKFENSSPKPDAVKWFSLHHKEYRHEK